MSANGWLPYEKWVTVQNSVPIVCVDVVLFNEPKTTKSMRCGLILRETPHQGTKWCLVGGRMLRGENFNDAILRQIGETLGKEVEFEITEDIQPAFVAQYFPFASPFCDDPRQHAIGLTFEVVLKGNPVAQGEAIDFKWFDVTSLPNSDDIGFKQHQVLYPLCRNLN